MEGYDAKCHPGHGCWRRRRRVELRGTEGREEGREEGWIWKANWGLNLCQVPFTTPLLYTRGVMKTSPAKRIQVPSHRSLALPLPLSLSLSLYLVWLSKCFSASAVRGDAHAGLNFHWGQDWDHPQMPEIIACSWVCSPLERSQMHGHFRCKVSF